jgi:predicted transcriptional regulator of viral defense system
MRKQVLDLLDDIAADERLSLTSAEVRERLDLSPQATSNLLARLVRDGLLDRVANGRYALRPLGRLGTRASSEDIALAVAAAFGAERHRIAYRSALDHHGLLVHPTRTVQVALPRQVKIARLSGRRLQALLEPADMVEVGSQPAGHGAVVSTIERALLESAQRPSLAGGWPILAEAIKRGGWDPAGTQALSHELRMEVGLRRIGSLAEQLGLEEAAAVLPSPATSVREVALDPRETLEDPWLDRRWRVRWPTSGEHARELVAA